MTYGVAKRCDILTWSVSLGGVVVVYMRRVCVPIN